MWHGPQHDQLVSIRCSHPAPLKPRLFRSRQCCFVCGIREIEVPFIAFGVLRFRHVVHWSSGTLLWADNECSCSNGVAATGAECTSNNANICMACTGYIYLSGSSCAAWDPACSAGQQVSFYIGEHRGSQMPSRASMQCVIWWVTGVFEHQNSTEDLWSN